jgi:hypothetical protein
MQTADRDFRTWNERNLHSAHYDMCNIHLRNSYVLPTFGFVCSTVNQACAREAANDHYYQQNLLQHGHSLCGRSCFVKEKHCRRENETINELSTNEDSRLRGTGACNTPSRYWTIGAGIHAAIKPPTPHTPDFQRVSFSAPSRQYLESVVEHICSSPPLLPLAFLLFLAYGRQCGELYRAQR